MKQCPQCGAQNKDGAHFCMSCAYHFKPEARKCPNGHPMDSTWTECVYCKNQAEPAPAAVPAGGPAVRTPTVAEGDRARPQPFPPPPPTPPARPAPPDASPRGMGAAPPPPPGAPPGRKRRVTQFVPPSPVPEPGGSAGPQPTAPGRRIVGVLITYTWKPDGQVFPLREGRNLIGRDPDQCEIAVPEDMTLSGTNSHITFRKSFVIGDMVSMSGTDLNGQPIEEQFCPLYNYAQIRTGSTYWTFVAVDPNTAADPELAG